MALSASWTVKVTDTAELPLPWGRREASPYRSTANSQKLEGIACVLTGNVLPDSTRDVLLGTSVLRAAFGTCERERRPLSPPIFPELREFLRKVKTVWCHKLLFSFCQRKLDYYSAPLLAFPSPPVQESVTETIHLAPLWTSL